ncbi:MAG TPA: general secretion pathway protein GspL [Xanthomonadaceae bacterium]|nr:general secretion pathway protein GspL [Xanthomonadaceae bacterium]
MATAPLAHLPDALRLRWAASPLPAALAGLRAELLDLLPPGLRRRWFPPVRRLWLHLQPGAIRLVEEAGRERIEHGLLPATGPEGVEALAAALERRGVEGELWALLPAGEALVRTLALPLAVEPQLAAALRHEIDRQTPFTADQVVFAVQVVSRHPAEGQLRAELAVLPKDRLDAALTALGPLAARLSGLDIDDSAHRTGRRRNLLPAAQRVPRSERDARVRLGLATGAAIALLLAGVLTLDNRERALAALEVARDAAYQQAREARALRQQLEAAAAAANFLAEQRAARPTMLELLDDLSQRLPDDVHLQRLTVEQQRVTLSGAARSAGTIVATLQPSPFLEGPALAGAVQQDRATGRDGFTVVAELVPGGADAPSP